jgi:AcrR family transcriptional regulator
MSIKIVPGKVLKAAVVLAKKHGYANISREQVATKAKCSTGTVSHKFGNMDGLRTEIMRHAVSDHILPIVVQGIASSHPIAMKAPAALRRKAINSLRT